MKPALTWSALLLALASCGRAVDEPAASIDPSQVPPPTAPPLQCPAPGCSRPATVIGHLITDCAWQALPSFKWAGHERALDVFLSEESPAGSLPPACEKGPFTSLALIYDAICGGKPCQTIEIDGRDIYRLDGTWETVEICMPVDRSGGLSCRSGQVFIPTGVSLSSSPPAPLARYFYAAEVAYEDVTVAGSELVYTRFEDSTGKCVKWIASAPCWSSADLISYRIKLAPAEAGAIRSAMSHAGFFGLASTLGGAGAYQRFYPVLIAAREDSGTLKEVTYQSFPGAAPMPDAFVASFELLASAVCKHLGKQVGGPSASTPSCP